MMIKGTHYKIVPAVGPRRCSGCAFCSDYSGGCFLPSKLPRECLSGGFIYKASQEHCYGRSYTSLIMDDLVTEPEQLLFNGSATIIISPSGKKTVVKCAREDRFNPRYGYLLAKFIESSGLSHRAAEKRLKEVDEEYQEYGQKLLTNALRKMVKND